MITTSSYHLVALTDNYSNNKNNSNNRHYPSPFVEPARTRGSGTTTRQTLLTSSSTQQDRTGRIPLATRVEGLSTVEEFKEKVWRTVEAYRQMLEGNRERARTGGTDPAATQRARTGLIRPTTTATGTSSHRDTTSGNF